MCAWAVKRGWQLNSDEIQGTVRFRRTTAGGGRNKGTVWKGIAGRGGKGAADMCLGGEMSVAAWQI